MITFDTGNVSLSQNGNMISVEVFVLGALKNVQSDMVVFTLQEVESAVKWVGKLQEIMMVKEYILLVQVQNGKVGLLTLVFLRKACQNINFKYLQMIEVPLRSNGGLALFIQANHSLLCFVNCRFQGGFLNRYLRLDDFN